MEQNFYWNKFAKSGSVLDYLYYKEAEKYKKAKEKDIQKRKQQIEGM